MWEGGWTNHESRTHSGLVQTSQSTSPRYRVGWDPKSGRRGDRGLGCDEDQERDLGEDPWGQDKSGPKSQVSPSRGPLMNRSG